MKIVSVAFAKCDFEDNLYICKIHFSTEYRAMTLFPVVQITSLIFSFAGNEIFFLPALF